MNKNNEPLRACSKCGGLHPFGTKCPNYRKDYRGQFSKRNDIEEAKIRSSTAWKKKREEIVKKSNYFCAYCFENNRLTLNNLEVHHITPIRENKSLAFDNNNLILLCRQCHKDAELGKINADFLRKLAREREFLSQEIHPPDSPFNRTEHGSSSNALGQNTLTIIKNFYLNMRTIIKLAE